MSTNATVTVELDGLFYSVYVHYDGYLHGVGNELVTYFNTLDKAMHLVGYGEGSYYIPSITEGKFEYRDGSERNHVIVDDYELIPARQYNYLFTDAGSKDGKPRWVWDEGEVEEDL